MINPAIFKTYDIRGKYPEEINEDNISKIITAYVGMFKPKKIVVGHDPLIGSKNIYPIICEKLSELGTEVYKADMCSSPKLFFASSYYKIQHALMLTASHLGEGYTGIKMLKEGLPPTRAEFQKFKSNYKKYLSKSTLSTQKGPINFLKTLDDDYISKIIQIVEVKRAKKHKVVFDANNGPNSKLVLKLINTIQLDAEVINKDIKDSNLSHPSNPKITKNRQQLLQAVKAHNAQIGILWDGDGDRAYFIDASGERIAPEYVGIQIARFLNRNGTSPKMTVDIRGSSAIEKELSKSNIKVKRIEAWHVPIKYEMDKDPKIGFGIETSGHYVFRDFYKIDDGLLASILFIVALDQSIHNVSDSLQHFRKKYYIPEEINYSVKHSEKEIVEMLKKAFSDGKINLIDGISVDYIDWRFNARMSRTEPVLRLNVSGTSQEKVTHNLHKIEKIIEGKKLND